MAAVCRKSAVFGRDRAVFRLRSGAGRGLVNDLVAEGEDDAVGGREVFR